MLVWRILVLNGTFGKLHPVATSAPIKGVKTAPIKGVKILEGFAMHSIDTLGNLTDLKNLRRVLEVIDFPEGGGSIKSR